MTSRLLILFIGLSLSAAARADASKFSSYDECILESLKGVSSDVAANAIIASCRSTFPEVTAVAPEAAAVAPASAEPAPVPPAESAPVEEPKPAAKPTVAAAGQPRELTQEELSNLKATLFGFTTKYKVTFENRNENITITEVTIAVWDDFDPRGLKKYTETMNVPPAGEQKVEYEVVYMGDDQGWRWKVDSAKGVPLIH
jgi:hypothetical protein